MREIFERRSDHRLYRAIGHQLDDLDFARIANSKEANDQLELTALPNGALENRCAVIRTVGSNPTLSDPTHCCIRDCGGYSKLHYPLRYTCAAARESSAPASPSALAASHRLSTRPHANGAHQARGSADGLLTNRPASLLGRTASRRSKIFTMCGIGKAQQHCAFFR